MTDVNFEAAKIKSRKKDIIVWSVIIGIVLLVGGWITVPKFIDWSEKRDAIAQAKSVIPSLEKKVKVDSAVFAQKESSFLQLAREPRLKEQQTFPEEIDVSKISKIIELYSLQVSLIENTPFEIEKLSFGKPVTIGDRRDRKNITSGNIYVKTSEKNFRGFLDFLQTGNLDPKFKRAKESGLLKIQEYIFLENNLLPIVHIDSVKISEDQKNTNLINAIVKLNFYSRYVKLDKK